MKELKIKIDGIHCDNCRKSIISSLSKNDKIKSVKVNDDVATISYENELDYNEVINTINDIGFETKEEYIINK